MAAYGKRCNRRKILIINEPLQKQIVLAISLMPTFGLAACTLIVAVFCRRLLGEASFYEIELPSLVPLFLSILAFTVAAGVVGILQAVRFSHRIAGPAYRLIKSMERMRSGDIAFRIQLRKGDHLTEIADEMNRLLDWLNANPPPGVIGEVLRAQPAAANDTPAEGERAAAPPETAHVGP
jgi:hypothetical protein